MIGRGATAQVHECISRWSGDRFVIKTNKANNDAEAFHPQRAIHNELRILQQCAKVGSPCPLFLLSPSAKVPT